MDISFIIPAYNEAENIEAVIASIRHYVDTKYRYEILVVDHGSCDATAELAEGSGAIVLHRPHGTIAGLRNHGVSHSSGKVLIFLDADISLTPAWQANIDSVMSSLTAGDRILTGSWVSIPEDPSWLEKFWFRPLQREDNSHINSGHLIIARQLFDEIGGFDDSMETGEDYEISMRAKKHGVELIDDVTLKVVHEGYPKTLTEFARREFWHGKGDATSLSAILQSRVAIVSLLFICLHAVLLGLLIATYWTAAIITAAAIIALVLVISSTKYAGEPVHTIIINSVIYYVYFWARALSTILLPVNKNVQKRSR